MSGMTQEEILHLGSLSRLALSPKEVETFRTEIDAILSYVGTVRDIVADDTSEPTPGPRYNVWRTDEVTNEPGHYTETLLAAMPRREGQFMVVKKILNQDE